jgi:hypothetical protein
MAENSAKVKDDSTMQEESDMKPKENELSSEDRGKDSAAKEEDSREWKKSGMLPLFCVCHLVLRTRNRGTLG